MEQQHPCKKCKKKSFFRDDDSGALICSSCGIVQDFDSYDAQLGGFNGPTTTFIHAGATGAGYFNYKEKKVVEAKRQIDDFVSRLDFSVSKADEVRDMIDRITDGEFGQGNWFPILIGACSYIVMKSTSVALSMAEVAATVGCDLHELGRMINRVADFLDLKLKLLDFNLVSSFERSLRICSYFESVPKETIRVMREQGVFLLQCAVKWFLSTGRRPLPMVAAVMVFVAEINRVEVKIEDIANEVNAAVSTSKTRYKELLKALVEVAQALPWGANITVKNIKINAPFVLKYMEMKSKRVTGAKRNDLQGLRFDMDDVVNASLSKGIQYGTCGNVEYGSQYYDIRNRNTRFQLNAHDSDMLRISHENSLMGKSKYLDKVPPVKEIGESGLHQGRKRSRDEMPRGNDLWTGNSEMCTQLSLNQLLEKDVGLNVVPPSFLYGCSVTEKRREKIKAAKLRINKIMHPANSPTGNEGEIVLSENVQGGKKRQRRRPAGDTEYEDFIIETLLLHQVKEEEIEKGHYKTLLDLYVFNSGVM